ncbi:MAG: hypothetical protein KIT72_18550 [Polyangiaceae bacterium]|nr:hypothetical protein [Polyangiaceae bacterium]MCW5792419.1 hypothetical protein [Polyangiaceae bacterium]
MGPVTSKQLRRLVESTWLELTPWLGNRAKLFELPHPEQQVLFELGYRLRENIRSLSSDPNWDRLYFDASTASSPLVHAREAPDRRPHLRIETRKLLGVPQASREHPDLAIELAVLRACPELVDYDDDGYPRLQRWTPISMLAQGRSLDESVAYLTQLGRQGVEGYLFVLYSNLAARVTSVDTRNIASWASWLPVEVNGARVSGLTWTSRHFKPRA